MTITLCFAPQSCARVPLIALEEIGVPFETRLIAFMAGEHRAPDYLALNPAGKVPALIVEDDVLVQNTAILYYLARRFPAAKLLPTVGTPLAEAQQIARLAWFSGDLHPLVTRIRMPQFACDLPESIPRVRQMASAAMAVQLTPVALGLRQKPWLLGTQWSVLDAYLYLQREISRSRYADEESHRCPDALLICRSCSKTMSSPIRHSCAPRSRTRRIWKQ